MEIGPYLRARPRTAAVALLLPLLAGVAAYLVLNAQPPEYSATATVSAPASTSSSTSRIGIFVADFGQVAGSTDVVEAVAATTGEPVADLQEGVEVTRLEVSSLFEVSYTGDGPALAEDVVRAVIAQTYTRLVGAGNEDAEVALTVASEQYNAAVAARQTYENEIGTLQPDRDYEDLSSRIRSLQADPDPKPGTAATIADLAARRDALVPQVRRAQELSQAVETAVEIKERAQEEVARTRAEAEEARGPEVIQQLSVDASSAPGGLVLGVGAAAVVGLLAGLALLVLPDVLRPRTAPPPRLAQRISLPGARDTG